MDLPIKVATLNKVKELIGCEKDSSLCYAALGMTALYLMRNLEWKCGSMAVELQKTSGIITKFSHFSSH